VEGQHPEKDQRRTRPAVGLEQKDAGHAAQSTTVFTTCRRFVAGLRGSSRGCQPRHLRQNRRDIGALVRCRSRVVRTPRSTKPRSEADQRVDGPFSAVVEDRGEAPVVDATPISARPTHEKARYAQRRRTTLQRRRDGATGRLATRGVRAHGGSSCRVAGCAGSRTRSQKPTATGGAMFWMKMSCDEQHHAAGRRSLCNGGSDRRAPLLNGRRCSENLSLPG